MNLKTLRIIVFFFVFMLGANNIYGQSDEDIDAFLDEFFKDETATVEQLLKQLDTRFLYLSVNYQNKTYFSGRAYGVDQFTFSPQIAYFFSKGWALSYNANYYSQSTPVWDNQNVGLSYNKRFKKSPIGVLGGLSYSLYANSAYSNQTYLSTGVYVNLNDYHYGGGIYYNTATSNFSSFQLSASAYTKIDFYTKGSEKLTLRPKLSLLWGTYTYQIGTTANNTTTYTNYSDFSKINTQFILPLHYYRGAFDLSLEYRMNAPTLLSYETSVPNSNYISLSAGYFFGM